MDGRKPNSTKWTAFPAEYVAQISSVFQETFGQELGQAQLVVEGKIYPEEICLRVGFREGASLRQNNFEVSVDFTPAKENAIETIYSCIDGIAALMTSYFEGTPAESMPIDWKPINFEKKTLYFQFSTVNSDLEASADKLLGDYQESLIKEFEDEASNDPEETMH